MARIALIALPVAIVLAIVSFLFWRYIWFYRNPPRTAPAGDNVVSPADGTVVYVKRLSPSDDVIVIKEGTEARIEDIVKTDIELPKLLIGIFMSPFSVHYNRAPFDAEVKSINHYPAKTRNLHMQSMHFRSILNLKPLYENSLHIVENERTVTRFEGSLKGSRISAYVIQIAGGSVDGIDSYFPPGETVQKGQIFGMIRIGSQVDLVVPDMPSASVKVSEGDRVFAGETILIE